jgi:hypothetical protein
MRLLAAFALAVAVSHVSAAAEVSKPLASFRAVVASFSDFF